MPRNSLWGNPTLHHHNLESGVILDQGREKLEKHAGEMVWILRGTGEDYRANRREGLGDCSEE